ncbi:protein IRX15-LIKE-like protein [Carex littledalei]|uniref:Protein IRX15-LIKE-like protein n=1 Tax=Carex littledalei TaxID=544730 RepID=A0A833RPN3_9POAL|nr:protein IRX15-LIKE-like protein [Carex littledalei]
MKNSNITPKLILFHPFHKPASGSSNGLFSYLASHHRLLILLFITCFTFASLFTFLYSTSTTNSSPYNSSQSTDTFTTTAATNTITASKQSSPLSEPVIAALIHYAANTNSTVRMPETDIRAVANILRRRGPCNLLVFGVSTETPLWIALNSGGRTVFLDENQYYIAYLEPRHPGLEAYDVTYTTRVRDLQDLLSTARATRATDCRPIQHLLFSECRLAVNDLPNHLYDVDWDIILIDGPSGWLQTSPGRTASIFSSAVMARSRRVSGNTEVVIHDYQFGLEKICAREFLCEENYIAETSTNSLGHFIIESGGPRDAFCVNTTDDGANIGLLRDKTNVHPLITK